jgi:hypothetical protein
MHSLFPMTRANKLFQTYSQQADTPNVFTTFSLSCRGGDE